MLAIKAGFHQMLVKIAKWLDPDQTQKQSEKQSDLGLHCLSRTICQASSV